VRKAEIDHFGEVRDLLGGSYFRASLFILE